MTALVETIIGNWVPSRRTPVISTSLRCASGCAFGAGSPRGRSRAASCSSAGTSIAAGRPDDLGRGPAEHRFGRGVERPDRAVESEREDPLGRVLDDRAVVRLAALRLVPRASCPQGLLGELFLGVLLVFTDRAGHADRDRRTRTRRGSRSSAPATSLRNDGIQPSSTISWPTAQPASDHPSAARHAAGPGLLEIGQRRERERHPERRTPAAQVDHRRHRGDVHRDPDVELERAGLGVSPPFEEPAHRLGHEDHGRVRPGRHRGDEPEVPQHQQQHERDRPHHVRQERRRQVGRGGSFPRARARPSPRPAAAGPASRPPQFRVSCCGAHSTRIGTSANPL